MRSKWNRIAKKFFLLSEKWMLKNSDIIVCDSLGIKDYIDNRYPKVKDKTIYIAYGSNTFDFSNINELEILNKYNLKKDNYCLMVGRCVPENNYELVIKEFMNSNIDKELSNVFQNYKIAQYTDPILKQRPCDMENRFTYILISINAIIIS